jgi:hypothetical protein
MEARGRYYDRDYYDEDDGFYGGAGHGSGAGQKRDDKFRRLPCRTFICTGTCPYRERCVYLHDPRIISRNVKSKSRRKNKDDVVSDAWFWPVMADEDLVLDNSGQPIVNQFYHVPLPRYEQSNSHNRSVYSMWMHFVEYCIDLSTKPSERANFSMLHSQHQVFCHPDELVEFRSGRKKSSVYVNMYTGEKRLNVFMVMSKGCSFDGTASTDSCLSPNSVIQSVSSGSLPSSAAATPVKGSKGVLFEEKAMQPAPARFISHQQPQIHATEQWQWPGKVDMRSVDSEASYEDSRPVAEVFYNNVGAKQRYEAVPAAPAVIKRKLDRVVPPVDTWTKTGAPSGFSLPMSMSFW